MDTIVIKDLRIFSHIGVNPEEKRDGQNFDVDIFLSLPLDTAGRTDNLDDTVSYSSVSKTAIRIIGQSSCDLIEYAAQELADAILSEYPPVCSVKIRLRKPEAPIKADFSYVAVEIERKRG